MPTRVSLRDLVDQRVIAVDSAEELGQVRHIVVDETASRVDAVHIAGKRSKAELVDWEAVESVGVDAVMVRSADDVHTAGDQRSDDVVRERITLIGARVLEADGFELGTLDDISFEAESGRITDFSVGSLQVPAERARAFGSHALVVDPAP